MTVVWILLSFAFIFGALRLFIAKNVLDRAIALDTLINVGAAFLVVLGFYYKRMIYLDIALIYALLAFVGSVVIARYLEKGV